MLILSCLIFLKKQIFFQTHWEIINNIIGSLLFRESSSFGHNSSETFLFLDKMDDEK